VGIVHHWITAASGSFTGIAKSFLGLESQSFRANHRGPRNGAE
jgi:hypothetical protein